MSKLPSDRKRSRGDSDSDSEFETDPTLCGQNAATAWMLMDSNGSCNGNQSAGQSAATAGDAGVTRFHDIASLCLDESVDLPEYVHHNANTLTFPEKVSHGQIASRCHLPPTLMGYGLLSNLSGSLSLNCS